MKRPFGPCAAVVAKQTGRSIGEVLADRKAVVASHSPPSASKTNVTKKDHQTMKTSTASKPTTKTPTVKDAVAKFAATVARMIGASGNADIFEKLHGDITKMLENDALEVDDKAVLNGLLKSIENHLATSDDDESKKARRLAPAVAAKIDQRMGLAGSKDRLRMDRNSHVHPSQMSQEQARSIQKRNGAR